MVNFESSNKNIFTAASKTSAADVIRAIEKPKTAYSTPLQVNKPIRPPTNSGGGIYTQPERIWGNAPENPQAASAAAQISPEIAPAQGTSSINIIEERISPLRLKDVESEIKVGKVNNNQIITASGKVPYQIDSTFYYPKSWLESNNAKIIKDENTGANIIILPSKEGYKGNAEYIGQGLYALNEGDIVGNITERKYENTFTPNKAQSVLPRMGWQDKADTLIAGNFYSNYGVLPKIEKREYDVRLTAKQPGKTTSEFLGTMPMGDFSKYALPVKSERTANFSVLRAPPSKEDKFISEKLKEAKQSTWAGRVDLAYERKYVPWAIKSGFGDYSVGLGKYNFFPSKIVSEAIPVIQKPIQAAKAFGTGAAAAVGVGAATLVIPQITIPAMIMGGGIAAFDISNFRREYLKERKTTSGVAESYIAQRAPAYAGAIAGGVTFSKFIAPKINPYVPKIKFGQIATMPVDYGVARTYGGKSKVIKLQWDKPVYKSFLNVEFGIGSRSLGGVDLTTNKIIWGSPRGKIPAIQELAIKIPKGSSMRLFPKSALEVEANLGNMRLNPRMTEELNLALGFGKTLYYSNSAGKQFRKLPLETKGMPYEKGMKIWWEWIRNPQNKATAFGSSEVLSRVEKTRAAGDAEAQLNINQADTISAARELYAQLKDAGLNVKIKISNPKASALTLEKGTPAVSIFTKMGKKYIKSFEIFSNEQPIIEPYGFRLGTQTYKQQGIRATTASENALSKLTTSLMNIQSDKSELAFSPLAKRLPKDYADTYLWTKSELNVLKNRWWSNKPAVESASASLEKWAKLNKITPQMTSAAGYDTGSYMVSFSAKPLISASAISTVGSAALSSRLSKVSPAKSILSGLSSRSASRSLSSLSSSFSSASSSASSRSASSASSSSNSLSSMSSSLSRSLSSLSSSFSSASSSASSRSASSISSSTRSRSSFPSFSFLPYSTGFSRKPGRSKAYAGKVFKTPIKEPMQYFNTLFGSAPQKKQKKSRNTRSYIGGVGFNIGLGAFMKNFGEKLKSAKGKYDAVKIKAAPKVKRFNEGRTALAGRFENMINQNLGKR